MTVQFWEAIAAAYIRIGNAPKNAKTAQMQKAYRILRGISLRDRVVSGAYPADRIQRDRAERWAGYCYQRAAHAHDPRSALKYCKPFVYVDMETCTAEERRREVRKRKREERERASGKQDRRIACGRKLDVATLILERTPKRDDRRRSAYRKRAERRGWKYTLCEHCHGIGRIYDRG